MSTSPPWAISQVFVPEGEGHVCCSCCEGYCLTEVGDIDTDAPETLVRVSGYVSDRYAAIRADLVRDVPDRAALVDHPRRPKSWTVPEEKPRVSVRRFTPSKAHRLLTLGITVHEGGAGKPQHLYLGDDHIGWLMPTTDRGMTLSETSALARTWEAMRDHDAAELADRSATSVIVAGLGVPPLDALMLLRRAAREGWLR